MVGGRRCNDVEGRVIHVSLGGIDDPVWRQRLSAIPTGLTIPDADVDALVEYGERRVSRHPGIGAIAAEAGVNPPPGASGAAPRTASRRAVAR